MTQLIQMRWLVALAAMLLIVVPAWSGPGADSGNEEAEAADATEPPVAGGEAGDDLIDGPFCTFEEQDDQQLELEDFWSCVASNWKTPPDRYAISRIMDGDLQVGIEIDDLLERKQEICFSENNADMSFVRVWADAGTTGHLGKIRMFQETPSGIGHVWVSVNGAYEIAVATGGPGGAKSAVQLTQDLKTALEDAYYVVTEGTSFLYVHRREIPMLPVQSITEVSLRTNDIGLVSFELAIEEEGQPYMEVFCRPPSPQ